MNIMNIWSVWPWGTQRYQHFSNCCIIPVKTRSLTAMTICPHHSAEHRSGLHRGESSPLQQRFYGANKFDTLPCSYRNFDTLSFVSARPCWMAEMASNKLWRSVSDQPFCDNQKPYRSCIRIKNEIAKPPYLILHHVSIMKTFFLASDTVSQKRQEKDSRT